MDVQKEMAARRLPPAEVIGIDDEGEEEKRDEGDDRAVVHHAGAAAEDAALPQVHSGGVHGVEDGWWKQAAVVRGELEVGEPAAAAVDATTRASIGQPASPSPAAMPSVEVTVAPTERKRKLTKEEAAVAAARAEVEALIASLRPRNRTAVAPRQGGDRAEADSDWLEALQELVASKLEDSLSRDAREKAAADVETEEEVLAGGVGDEEDDEQDGDELASGVRLVRRSDKVLDGLSSLTLDQARLVAPVAAADQGACCSTPGPRRAPQRAVGW